MKHNRSKPRLHFKFAFFWCWLNATNGNEIKNNKKKEGCACIDMALGDCVKMEGSGVSLPCSTSALPSRRNGRAREGCVLQQHYPECMFEQEMSFFWGRLLLFSPSQLLCVLINLLCVTCMLISGWRKWVYVSVSVAFDRKNINILMRNVCRECRAGFAFPRKHLGVEFQAIINFHSIKIESSLN